MELDEIKTDKDALAYIEATVKRWYSLSRDSALDRFCSALQEEIAKAKSKVKGEKTDEI